MVVTTILKFIPKIIDILDDFSVFKKQGAKRLAYYRKCNYNISIFNNDGLEQVKAKNMDHSIISECLIDDD